MTTLTLIRVANTGKATLGHLLAGHQFLMYTLEPPWQGNEHNTSSIPAGSYECRWADSPRFGWTWELDGVPGRTDILIHAGNWPRDTEGCIMVGLHIMEDANGYRLTQSRAALGHLFGLYGRESLLLRIRQQALYIPGEQEIARLAATDN